MTDWSSLKVVDLRSELTSRGLPTKGVKAELIERLTQADLDAAQTQDFATEESALPIKTSEAEVPAVEETNTTQPEAGADPALSTSLTSSEVVADMQGRKRQSSAPPPSSKRVRHEEERQAEQHEDVVDFDTDDIPSGLDKRSTNGSTQEQQVSTIGQSNRKEEEVEDVTSKEQTQTPVAIREAAATAEQIVTDKPQRASLEAEDIQMQDMPVEDDSEIATVSVVPEEGPPDFAQASSGQQQPLSESRESEFSQSADTFTASNVEVGYDESDSFPSEHSPTNSLYIRELMRPLKAETVEQYILDLFTPPDGEPDLSLIKECYLDQIRTHAFVELKSVAAAQRVRAALHNQVWPNERNRKPLWVDFVPSNEVRAWIERETSATRGRQRWEVIYEKDGDTVVAIHREAGSDGSRFSKPPPTGPATAGPVYPGIEAAPRGPRGPRGRGVRAAFDGFNSPQTQQTQIQPSLFFTPQNEDVARTRIQNMRSFYSREVPSDLGKDYHRFTFENVDSFVNRGREVFIGIRPPHRQREHEERLQRGQMGITGESRRNDQRPPPRPPVTDEDRFSRYDGGRRADRPPRNRGFRGPGRFRGEDPYRYRPGY
ncbi:hypothetical protein BD289DRAFT_373642 [Coniella lustricola]|uniref:SAP domain-containing protein n=1 Tax=Coniella lustricola TaxID=2025994 RepID=A0A2T3A0L9_9PEZI|nr:hypothetical protein BD289DRAFT_373642 [Coniella lustricola]